MEELLTTIENEYKKNQDVLMHSWTPSRPTFKERGGVRVYVHKDTKDREVRDGKVVCLVHEEVLREYADKRGTVQRKCRSCMNEYMRNWSTSTSKGQLNDLRKNSNRRKA